jgi:uncharacterized protein YjiS (DUF1127 family)
MAYISLPNVASRPALFSALRAKLAAARTEFQIYREKRAIYLRTLRELQSYRPHELHDLKIHPANFEEVARKQAGW